jgi:hypothetical protein
MGVASPERQRHGPAWRRNKVRHDECVELAKIIRGLDAAVLAA